VPFGGEPGDDRLRNAQTSPRSNASSRPRTERSMIW
jgi:hypothetical protein